MAKSMKQAVGNVNDELYTPKILVEAIKEPTLELYKKLEKKLKRKPIIWLPFDTEDSEFAYFCRENKLKYVTSHISEGKDFFEYEPKQWDMALSNPPFSKKLKVFERLNKFKKPWAMLMNIMALNYQEIGHYFADHPCQLFIVDKRISFNGSQSSFNTSYICGNNYLPKDLIFKHVDNNNAKSYFVPSRMIGKVKAKKKRKK